jgi:hypothetical protein
VEESISHYVFLVVHLIVGSALVYIAMKAFRKTKYPPMALLALGFSLIVIGDTILGDVLSFLEQEVLEIIEESIEIAGFLVLILAVKRS